MRGGRLGGRASEAVHSARVKRYDLADRALNGPRGSPQKEVTETYILPQAATTRNTQTYAATARGRCLSLQLFQLSRSPAFTSFTSASTISLHSASTGVVASQPSTLFAFAGLPRSRSTSVGL